MGEVRETPNTALQAKLSENFDFSQRSLEESKQSTAGAEETKAAAAQQSPKDDMNEGEEEDADGGDNFFDSFSKSGPEPRGRGGRGMRERVN